jgi:hypothetical protein
MNFFWARSALLVGRTVRKGDVSLRTCFSHTQSVYTKGGENWQAAWRETIREGPHFCYMAPAQILEQRLNLSRS